MSLCERYWQSTTPKANAFRSHSLKNPMEPNNYCT